MKPWILIYFVILIFVVMLGYLYTPDYVTNLVLQTIDTAQYKALPTHNRFKLGLYTINPLSDQFNAFKSVSNLVGYKSQYFLEFISWGDENTLLNEKYNIYTNELDASPIVTWEPWKRDFQRPDRMQPQYSLESINSGFHDEYIKRFGESLKSVNGEVILRFGHEMNTVPGYAVWYPWQGNPDAYKEAFRRIVTIFRDSNIGNVRFMWNPIYFAEAASPDLYYPGDEYVDVIGFTVINLGNIRGTNGEKYEWVDCSVLIDNQYNALVKYNKELIITELLSNEIGGNKALWYKNCFETLETKKEISTIISVQIDENYEYTHNKVDWRINSSSSSLEEFRYQLRLAD